MRTRIDPETVMNEDLGETEFLHLGKNVQIRRGARLVNTQLIHLGDNVVVRPGCFIYAAVTRDKGDAKIIIEDDALIGNSVHIYNSNHEFESSFTDPILRMGHRKPEDIILKKGCWIGSCSIILPGVVIGENSVIGAGSVVTHSVPHHCLAAGNPAKVIRRLDSKTFDYVGY